MENTKKSQFSNDSNGGQEAARSQLSVSHSEHSGLSADCSEYRVAGLPSCTSGSKETDLPCCLLDGAQVNKISCRVYAQALIIHAGQNCSSLPMQEAFLEGKYLHVVLSMSELPFLSSQSFVTTTTSHCSENVQLAATQGQNECNSADFTSTASFCLRKNQRLSKSFEIPSEVNADSVGDQICSDNNSQSISNAAFSRARVANSKPKVLSHAATSESEVGKNDCNYSSHSSLSDQRTEEYVVVKDETQHDPIYIAVEEEYDYDENDRDTSKETKHHDSSSIEHSESQNNIYECSICKMTFAMEDYLIRHSLRCRDPVMAKFKCNLCSSGFTTKNGLDMHVDTVHLKKREFGCAICGKLFTRKHILKIHYATHSGLQEFKCDVCNKSFNQKSNFTRHARIHEHKSKGYKCRYCGQSFSQNAYLKNHVRCHEGINSRLHAGAESVNVYVMPSQ